MRTSVATHSWALSLWHGEKVLMSLSHCLNKQRRWKSPKNLGRIAFLSTVCVRFPVFELCARQPVHGHKPMRNKNLRKCSEVWQPQRWSDTLDLNAGKISDFIYSVWTRTKTDEKFVWLFLNEIESLASVKDISYCARDLFLVAIRTLIFKLKWTFVRILCFELSTKKTWLLRWITRTKERHHGIQRWVAFVCLILHAQIIFIVARNCFNYNELFSF